MLNRGSKMLLNIMRINTCISMYIIGVLYVSAFSLMDPNRLKVVH